MIQITQEEYDELLKSEPTTASKPVADENLSMVGAMARTAGRSILPTLAAVAVGRVLPAALMATGVGSVPALFGAGLTGALGAGAGTALLQNKYLRSPEDIAQESADVAAYPKATLAAELAVGLPFGLPAPGKALSGLIAPFKKAPMSTASKLNSANVAAGLGLGAGMEGVNQYSREEFQPGRLAMAALGGATMVGKGIQDTAYFNPKKVPLPKVDPTEAPFNKEIDSLVAKEREDVVAAEKVLAEQELVNKETQQKVEKQKLIEEEKAAIKAREIEEADLIEQARIDKENEDALVKLGEIEKERKGIEEGTILPEEVDADVLPKRLQIEANKAETSPIVEPKVEAPSEPLIGKFTPKDLDALIEKTAQQYPEGKTPVDAIYSIAKMSGDTSQENQDLIGKKLREVKSVVKESPPALPKPTDKWIAEQFTLPLEENIDDGITLYHGQHDFKSRIPGTMGRGKYYSINKDEASAFSSSGKPVEELKVTKKDLDDSFIESGKRYTHKELRTLLKTKEGQKKLDQWEDKNIYPQGITGHQLIGELGVDPSTYGIKGAKRSDDRGLREVVFFPQSLPNIKEYILKPAPEGPSRSETIKKIAQVSKELKESTTPEMKAQKNKELAGLMELGRAQSRKPSTPKKPTILTKEEDTTLRKLNDEILDLEILNKNMGKVPSRTEKIKELSVQRDALLAKRKSIRDQRKGEAGFIITDPIIKFANSIIKKFKSYDQWASAMDESGNPSDKELFDYVEKANNNEEPPILKGVKPKTEGEFLGWKLVAAVTDKLKLKGKEGKYIADHLNDVLLDAHQKHQYYNNKMKAHLGDLTPEESDQLRATLEKEYDDNKSYRDILNEKQQLAYDDIRAALKEYHIEQRKEAMPIVEGKDRKRRPPKDNPFYWMHMMDRNVIRTLNDDPTTPEARRLEKIYTDYLTENLKGKDGKPATPEEIKEQIDVLRTIAKGDDTSIRFGATRKAEGIGLPPEFREKNLDRVIERYTRRASTDIAFFKHVEKDAISRKILNLKNPYDGKDYFPIEEWPTGEGIVDMQATPEVKTIFDHLGHKINHEDYNLLGGSSLLHSFLLGPATAMTDVLSTPFVMLAHSNPDEFGAVAKAMLDPQNLKKSWDEAIGSGFSKISSTTGKNLHEAHKSFQRLTHTLGEQEKTVTDISEVFVNMSRLMNQLQGREFADKAAKAMAWAGARAIVGARVAKTYQGDEKAMAQLSSLMDGLDLSAYAHGGQEMPKSLVDKMTYKVAEFAQPRYDPSTNPAWADETRMMGSISRLARWSIAQQNVFFKKILGPAIKDGDYSRLLIALGSSVVGGLGNLAMREMVAGKKNPTPSFAELSAGEDANMADYANKLLTIISASGFMGGVITDIAKSSFNAISGQKAYGYSIPLLEWVHNTTNDTFQMISAMYNGEIDFMDGMQKLMAETAQGTSQLARIVNSNVLSSEEAKLSDMYRDYSVYQRLSKEGGNKQDIQFNPYKNYYQRKFKQTSDIKEASLLLPRVMGDIKKKAGDPNSPLYEERYEKGVKGLRSIPINLMPSPNSSPEELKSYLDFIKRTQGTERVKEIIAEYARMESLREEKRLLTE